MRFSAMDLLCLDLFKVNFTVNYIVIKTKKINCTLTMYL